jgi:hypothetical protein
MSRCWFRYWDIWAISGWVVQQTARFNKSRRYSFELTVANKSVLQRTKQICFQMRSSRIDFQLMSLCPFTNQLHTFLLFIVWWYPLLIICVEVCNMEQCTSLALTRIYYVSLYFLLNVSSSRHEILDNPLKATVSYFRKTQIHFILNSSCVPYLR